MKNRLFIGIDLDDRTRGALQKTLDSLGRRFQGVRWVAPESLHIPLKFIGDVSPQELCEIFATAEKAVSGQEPFHLEITGLGAFPDLERPRVVWAGCEDGCEELLDLVEAVELSFASIGYPPEKQTFHPHVTLGRLKPASDALGLEAAIEQLSQKKFGSIHVREMVVFTHNPSKRGLRHSAMQRVRL